jgi:hypothetical protein
MHPPRHIRVHVTVPLSAGAAGLHELQRALRHEGRRALLAGLVAALADVEETLVAAPIHCTRCQGIMRSRGRTRRRLVTVFGPLEVRRRRYACVRCRTVRRPLDEWMGVPEGTDYTAAVRELALFLAADLSYERAADALRHLSGIVMSGRQIQLLLEDEGATLEEASLAAPPAVSGATLRRRFRRASDTPEAAGRRRLLQLQRLKSSGGWDRYWARRADALASHVTRTPAPTRMPQRAEGGTVRVALPVAPRALPTPAAPRAPERRRTPASRSTVG